jgi:hypothetical protein
MVDYSPWRGHNQPCFVPNNSRGKAVKKMKRGVAFSRGEKRWACDQADTFVCQAKRSLHLYEVIALGLPSKIHWTFSKEVVSSTHYFYQAVYKSTGVTMRFWAVADPRRNFDHHNLGFQVIRDREVIYDFAA